jgi:nucleosome binding factor SPN SPT16 subunit
MHVSHVIHSLLSRAPVRPISLPDLYIRPTLGGRRSTGTLELHKNGFRFRSSKGGHIDILFKNIKHAFFQPAENEVITIIHFHLWHPIMVGKKKTSVRVAATQMLELYDVARD